MPEPSPRSAASDIVGRLAPSPTGRLHLGHARSFLIAWWSARSRGGRVVLRIEDLDGERVKPGATELVLEDLAWLGLDWDGEPLFQTARTQAHREALDHLLQRGLAYPCVCTRREIEEAASAPHAGDEETRYPGTCRGRFASLEEARSATGREPAIRLLVQPGPVRFEDVLHGAQSIDVAATSGDFVIGRKDGLAAYQLATPLDDDFQSVTEVLRGEDLLPSAARQKLVLSALGRPFPTQIHVPLVQGPDGLRLAKRAGSLSLQELREAGVRSESLATWAAASAGVQGAQEAPTPSPASEWLAAFELKAVPIAEPVRTPESLPHEKRT
ncbi:Glutamate--tRNA ligase [Planctomycetes bacterium Poly30]|uniref:Glutamyl-Q tRNA(Asp) synthetase n=1 Tax=Saltatorellus ferox TaxID=2528018 RepID=A0A518ET56_9BACT|nr:Glutamate--tRNA ligase [Planctomycetes bacterium Poly30]